MKLNDVKIGGEYEARIAGGTMQVRILAEKASGGWKALNLATKKKVFVPLARQLREPDTTATTTTDGNLTVVEVPQGTFRSPSGRIPILGWHPADPATPDTNRPPHA